MGTWLPYVTGGIAWAGPTSNSTTSAPSCRRSEPAHVGWTAGTGLEYAVGGNWTAKAEYDYIDLARRTYDLSDLGLPHVNVDPNIHTFKLGLNYGFGIRRLAGIEIQDRFCRQPADWNIHAQTTFLPQAYPGFRSPYEGANSLPGGGQGRETLTTSAFLGWKLWHGGEFYFNPELAQGFGLNGTLGLAGFPNGEAQKGGAPYPRFGRSAISSGRPSASAANRKRSRRAPINSPASATSIAITVTVGRFAVGDFFDGNSYAKDPRADFMNWAMWSSAAYDFPADLPGFTRGGVVELNRKDWAVRAGLFQVPRAEQRHPDLQDRRRRGRIRRALHDLRSARQTARRHLRQSRQYRQLPRRAGDQRRRSAARHQRCDRRHPRDHTKYGFYVNGEQQIMKDVGVFGRVSWNDGQNEILSFTDIDRSVSGGLSIKGSYWGRAKRYDRHRRRRQRPQRRRIAISSLPADLVC